MYMYIFSNSFYCCYKPLPLCWAFVALCSFPPPSLFLSASFFFSLFYNFNFLKVIIFFSTFIPLFAFPTVLFP